MPTETVLFLNIAEPELPGPLTAILLVTGVDDVVVAEMLLLWLLLPNMIRSEVAELILIAPGADISIGVVIPTLAMVLQEMLLVALTPPSAGSLVSILRVVGSATINVPSTLSLLKAQEPNTSPSKEKFRDCCACIVSGNKTI